jgi:hypothetical protein
VAKNPDPTLTITTSKGVSRTLDDWTTMFHLCLVVLVPSPAAAAWIPVAERIFATLGDADCRCAFVVPASQQVADRLLGPVAETVLTFVDPSLDLVRGLDLERLPALVHLGQDAALAGCAEGWDPEEWQAVVRGVGAAMAWTVPEVAGPEDPRPTPGWLVSAL